MTKEGDNDNAGKITDEWGQRQPGDDGTGGGGRGGGQSLLEDDVRVSRR